MSDENDIPFSSYSVDYSSIGVNLLNSDSGSSMGGLQSFFMHLWDIASTVWTALTFASLALSSLLIFGIIYAYIRATQYGELETEYVKNNEKLYAQIYGGANKNSRWDDVETHIQSERPNDWKLAIIEADIMLGELLDVIGLGGNTIGEKLKSASASSFKTLDQAWRAHRVRNQIAHEGADFVLTKKMAQDTITQYRMVFQEFELV